MPPSARMKLERGEEPVASLYVVLDDDGTEVKNFLKHLLEKSKTDKCSSVFLFVLGWRQRVLPDSSQQHNPDASLEIVNQAEEVKENNKCLD